MSDDERQLDRARTDVVRRYADRSSAAAVEAEFDTLVAEFEGARLRTVVPLLVERQLRTRLQPSG